ASGSAPPSFLYKSRTARKMRARTSWSLFACPGGSIAFHFHCIQRDELVKVPSFSAKFAAGSWYTVVWMSFGAAPPYSLGAFQKVAVSFSKFSAITSHFSFESAATIFGQFGPT